MNSEPAQTWLPESDSSISESSLGHDPVGKGVGLLQKQQGVLADFKAGKLNTLVATAVAEEGLDLTHCRLVVRFDLPATPLVFIQSRGRARARNSSMVLMVERGNEEQLALLAGVHRSAAQ